MARLARRWWWAADAGMLSASNLKELDAAGLSFIVGSHTVKAQIDLASHFHWHGDVFTDGQITDTVTPRHGNTIVNDCSMRDEPVWALTLTLGHGGRSGSTGHAGHGAINEPCTPRKPAPARSSPARRRSNPPDS